MAFSRFTLFGPIALILFATVFFPGLSAAQDMDTIEGVYRQQYEQYTGQEAALQQQINALLSQKDQVDGLISQITGQATQNYTQEAERYRQLQLLLPSAIQYSRDLADREKLLTQVQQRKAQLRAAILERQSSLPIWWTQ
jgi:uncharacterized phage infection (PIP) family protein YhgE